MQRRTKFGLAAGAVVVAVGCGTGIAVASSGGDDQTPITGAAYDRAVSVALATTGGGRVTETEAGDEESTYQVEVTLDDGSQVDVNLDAQFNVVGTKHEGGESKDGADEGSDGSDG